MPHAIVVCGSTIYDRTYTDRNFSILRRLYDRCLDYRRFASAALDCCQIAAGRAEIFFECRLSPWDYAAGTLIAQEAGATATRLEGGPMDPLHAGRCSSPTACATASSPNSSSKNEKLSAKGAALC